MKKKTLTENRIFVDEKHRKCSIVPLSSVDYAPKKTKRKIFIFYPTKKLFFILNKGKQKQKFFMWKIFVSLDACFYYQTAFGNVERRWKTGEKICILVYYNRHLKNASLFGRIDFSLGRAFLSRSILFDALVLVSFWSFQREFLEHFLLALKYNFFDLKNSKKFSF